MENSYRDNVVDFCKIYLNKIFNEEDNQKENDANEFVSYVFKVLFDIDIDIGYGLDSSTRIFSNDIGDLKIYNEDDYKKNDYLKDIKIGDLVFFHTKSLESNSVMVNNYYPGHVGIFCGNKQFVHTDIFNNMVVIDELDEKWLDILVASRDVIKEILNRKRAIQ